MIKFKSLGVLAVLGIMLGIVFAQEDLLDFVVPAPPGVIASQAVPEMRVAGRDIKCMAYQTSKDIYVLIDFYQRFFQAAKFKQSSDGALFDAKVRKLRFKKEELVVDVLLTERQENGVVKGMDVGILKYLQKEGEQDLEKSKLSVKDTMFALPIEDVPGNDLEFIPRPPKSIRWGTLIDRNPSFLSYGSDLPLEELKDFYKSAMLNNGWNLEKENSTAAGLDRNKEAYSKIESPFSDGEDFNEVMRQSYSLEFIGSRGRVEIILMNNFSDKKLGSVAQIVYYGTDNTQK